MNMSSCISYSEVEPLHMPIRIHVRTEIQLVVRFRYSHNFGQIPRLKTGFEPQILCPEIRWTRWQ